MEIDFYNFYTTLALNLQKNGYDVYFIGASDLWKYIHKKDGFHFAYKNEIDSSIKKLIVWNGKQIDLKKYK